MMTNINVIPTSTDQEPAHAVPTKTWCDSIWQHKPTIASCSLLSILFVVATVNILALTPVYIETKNINSIDNTATTTVINVIYTSNVTNGSSLVVVNLETLSNIMMDQLQLTGINVDDARFITRTNANVRKKRRASDVGDWFIMSMTIKCPSKCIFADCKQKCDDKWRQNIGSIHSIIYPHIYFSNGEKLDVRLLFHSYGPFLIDPFITTESSTSTITSNVTNKSTYMSPKPRALVSVDVKSIVGILFDDIPMDARDVAKRLLDEKDDGYWKQLATQQMQYTQVRLIFRPLYYKDIKPPTKRGTLSLTLPEFFEIKFLSLPYFATIDNHYLYVRNYTFHNILITDADSLAESDDRLAQINGSMIETFNMPVDPFLVLQRTGFACMDEAQWTPYSIDPETTEVFYDDVCDVEAPQAENLTGCQQCHCTYPLPTVSCVDALKQNIGHIKFDLVFKRIPDDPVLADQWRFPKEGPSINAFGEVAPTNLFEYKPALTDIRFIYLYIEPDGCEIVERCVTGSGWRRLLVFTTTTPNYGIEDLNLGQVSYFANGAQSDYVSKHRIFEYSPCHKHFHFSHYAQYRFGINQTITFTKRGFCLQTTYRHANTEWSVMSQNHYLCSNQGISPGWSDTYQGGIRCQWIDVTTFNTSVSMHTDKFSSSLNPDGFLCEGTPLNNTWLPTNFTTMCCGGSGCCGDSPETQCCGGLPVEKQGCTRWRGSTDDNTETFNVTIPIDGEGQVTADCANSSGKWSEKRDCGFRLHPQGKMLTCPTPGQNVTLKNVTASTFYQVVRICEASIVINSCLACIWNSSLTTKLIRHDTLEDIHFICTPQRNSQEVGGKFCIYIAPLFEEMDHNPNFVQWSSIE